MRKITQEKLNGILEKHKLWLDSDGNEGKQANLSGANLSNADLSKTNLNYADLSFANLRNANLIHAGLKGANLSGTNLDYSAFPLWCGSLKAEVDNKIAVQLLYHTLAVVKNSPHVSQELKDGLLTEQNIAFANRFHRAHECKILS